MIANIIYQNPDGQIVRKQPFDVEMLFSKRCKGQIRVHRMCADQDDIQFLEQTLKDECEVADITLEGYDFDGNNILVKVR